MGAPLRATLPTPSKSCGVVGSYSSALWSFASSRTLENSAVDRYLALIRAGRQAGVIISNVEYLLMVLFVYFIIKKYSENLNLLDNSRRIRRRLPQEIGYRETFTASPYSVRVFWNSSPQPGWRLADPIVQPRSSYSRITTTTPHPKKSTNELQRLRMLLGGSTG